MILKKDALSGANVQVTTRGIIITAPMYLMDVPYAPDLTQENAITAAIPLGCPGLYTKYPEGIGSVVREITVEPMSPKVLKLIVRCYLDFIPRIVRMTTTPNTYSTQFDINGKKAAVNYTPSTQTAGQKFFGLPPAPWIARLPRDASIVHLTFEFISGDPGEGFTDMVDSLNLNQWRGRAKNYWKFSQFSSETRDAILFNWYLTFSYNPLSWRTLGVYEDLFGRVPGDIEDIDYTKDHGNGWTLFNNANTLDFAQAFPFIPNNSIASVGPQLTNPYYGQLSMGGH